MPDDKGRLTRLGGLAILAAAAAIILPGCSGSKVPSVASVTTTTSKSAPSRTNGSQAGLREALLKYAECMRSDGVPKFPDPGAGGGFEIPVGSGVDPSSSAFKAAQAKCRKLMPGGGPPGPGTTTHPAAQWLAHMVKVAECMRQHGIPGFPDPRTSVPSLPPGGGVISDMDGVIFVFPATLDSQSPAFARAAKACGFPLHNH